MKRQSGLRAIILSSGVVLASLLGGCSVSDKREKRSNPHPLHMDHISTQAEAEALQPGDSLAMVCSMCKNVVVHQVGKDKAHLNMMTAGQGHTCAGCSGSVTVVGTGQGEGDRQELKHVCSKCGADAMFVCATKPSSGSK